MATASILLIAGIPVTPGTPLTSVQMAVISLSLSMGNKNSYPEYVLTQFYSQGGSASAANPSATPVSPTTNPQVPSRTSTETVGNFLEEKFAINNPTAYKQFVEVRKNLITAITDQYLKDGSSPRFAEVAAKQKAQKAATTQFAKEIVAAGAGTIETTTTTTPTPTTQTTTPPPVSPTVNPQAPAAIDRSSSLKARAKANAAQNPVSPTVDPAAAAALTPPAPNSRRQFNTTAGGATTALQPRSEVVQAAVTNARNQPAQQVILGNEASNGDWRLKLSLSDNADYFYNDPNNPGILGPLKATNGVIFPYTPKIDIGYKTNYQAYDVTHSNFRGYYYQNSQVGDIGISAQFTAQNTDEANYLLAVIHFFRSVGKMFYGQDAQRGTPPPLLFLTGLGEYQFNKHPVLLTSFTYGLPNDVDYIRTNVANQTGTNLTERNNVKQSTPTSSNAVSSDRLSNAGLTQGALPNTPFGSSPTTPALASGAPTYVPTKIDISIALHPINTRQQISQQFSLKQFANGNLLRGGFW
jgi:hypothetical protein